MINVLEIAQEGIKQGIRGGLSSVGATVVTGTALTTAPVHVLWFIPITTSTVLATPVVVTAGIVGAVGFGAVAAWKCYAKQRDNDRFVEDALKAFPQEAEKAAVG